MEFLNERGGQRHIGIGKFGEQLDKLLRFLLGRREHTIRPYDGRIAFLATMGDTEANATQVFQNRQLQHVSFKDRKSVV